MLPALLLIDVQNDYLRTPALKPPRESVCESMAQLLMACRTADIPVFHVWTTIRNPVERMPHWSSLGISRCVVKTPGHETPELLRPLPGESIIHKRFYSAFTDSTLAVQLRKSGVDTLLLVGVYLRACVRTTAIDAYQNGFTVVIGEDAVADDDPVHSVVTRQYLSGRIAHFVPIADLCQAVTQPSLLHNNRSSPAPPILSGLLVQNQVTEATGAKLRDHVSPRDAADILWRVPIGTHEHVCVATRAARSAWSDWQTVPLSQRVEQLCQVADRLTDEMADWAVQIALETGKPVREARLEVTFAADLLRVAAQTATSSNGMVKGRGWRLRRRPIGVVAIITPWNNPLAIPLGKLAPALLFGNTVVWKPAIPGASVAARVFDLLREIGLPPGLVNIVQGDRSTAEAVMSDPDVNAVSLTGSSLAGCVAQVVCARRGIPLQAELGGNNAAIVWSDANLEEAAQQIAWGGFGSAGQRCTANRRVIVAESVYGEFVEQLRTAIGQLPFGDPLDEATVVGPVVSQEAMNRIAATVDRARRAGAVVYVEQARTSDENSSLGRGCYYPPTLICCPDLSAEIVQEETFGPVVVVQSAKSWRQALHLCNGVKQGLAAAVFTQSPELQQQFLNEACAGLLKINASTAGAAGEAPFGGWKASGIGPPEHGVADVEFYTRLQTVYQSE